MIEKSYLKYGRDRLYIRDYLKYGRDIHNHILAFSERILVSLKAIIKTPHYHSILILVILHP